MTKSILKNSIRKHEVRFLRFEKAVFSKVAALTGATSLAVIAGWQGLLDNVQAGTSAFAAEAGVEDLTALERMYADVAGSIAALKEAAANGVDVTAQAEALVLNIATVHERLVDVLPAGYQPMVRGEEKTAPPETVKMIMSAVTG